MDDFSKISKKEGDGLNLNFKQDKYDHLFKLELQLELKKIQGMSFSLQTYSHCIIDHDNVFFFLFPVKNYDPSAFS